MDNQREFLYKEAYQKRLRDVLNGVDTDWLSKPLRTGVGQRYNLRVEGGSEEFRWAADAQYNDVEGAMKGSKRRTFNGGITLLYTYKNLTFRNYTSVGINGSQESPYGTFSKYVQQQPYNAPMEICAKHSMDLGLGVEPWKTLFIMLHLTLLIRVAIRS